MNRRCNWRRPGRNFTAIWGAVLLRLHRTDEAIAQQRLAIQYQPDNMSYHYNLASALLTAQQTNAAVAEFNTPWSCNRIRRCSNGGCGNWGTL